MWFRSRKEREYLVPSEAADRLRTGKKTCGVGEVLNADSPSERELDRMEPEQRIPRTRTDHHDSITQS